MLGRSIEDIGRTSATMAPFRGGDRRARDLEDPPVRAHECAFAGVVLLALTACAFLLDGARYGLDARALNASAIAIAAVVTVLTGSASILRWRLTGEAPPLRAGIALELLACGGIGLGCLIPLLAPHSNGAGWPTDLRWAATTTALILFALAITRPEVDTKLRPPRVVAASIAATAALTVLLESIPWLTRPIGNGSTGANPSGALPVQIAAIVALALLGIAYSERAIHRERWSDPWLGMMLFGLALAFGVWASADSPLEPRVAVGALIAAFASALALNGDARELARVYMAQRARHFDAEVNAELAHARTRTERAARDEWLHDTRSAIAAVKGAARVLEARVEQLTPGDRASLTSAIGAELARVSELISGDPGDAPQVVFGVHDALLPLICCQRSLGRTIRTDIPDFLRAFGRPVAAVEIIQNLLDNAARHAPGSTIIVRARRGAGRVRIEVEDQGPGVPVAAKSTIFARGVRTPAGGGSGLGLFVARRLALEDGGDLFVEDAPSGGAIFVLELAEGSTKLTRTTNGGRARRAESLQQAPQRRHVTRFDHDDFTATA